jgi:hypothetical protein
MANGPAPVSDPTYLDPAQVIASPATGRRCSAAKAWAKAT